MTLDETWKNCLSMWRWIAKQKQIGEEAIAELKGMWLSKHGHRTTMWYNCFFCERARGGYTKEFLSEANTHCPKCPARKIDNDFSCLASEYHHETKPKAFYNKLVSLDRKRKKAKK